MRKFIIGYGWGSEVDTIEAPDQAAALEVATRLSIAEGLSDPQEWSWAEPYSDLLARDVGLIDTQRSQAPYWA